MATTKPILLFDTVTRRHCYGSITIDPPNPHVVTVTGVAVDPLDRWRVCRFPERHRESVARARAARQVP